MVARGDLGSELPHRGAPAPPEGHHPRCIALGRPVITATQMLESMVHAATPTRAEASDIANAVFDGTSSVMLSGETAIGHDPVSTVATMARIADRADEEFDYDGWAVTSDCCAQTDRRRGPRCTDAMTTAAWRGRARDRRQRHHLPHPHRVHRPLDRPLPAPGQDPSASRHDERTVRQLSLSWGAGPYLLERTAPIKELVQEAIDIARRHGKIRLGDLVAVLHGSDNYPGRATDTLRMIRVDR